MKEKLLLSAVFIVLCINGLGAQNVVPNASSERLKGAVKSVYTSVRSPKGNMVSQPINNVYDRDGKLMQVTYFDTNGNSVYSVNYSYDKKNRVVKNIGSLEPYNEIISQTTYTYDSKHHSVDIETMGIADSLNIQVVMQCDKEGHVVSEVTYDEAGTIINTTKYEYNSDGMMRYATYYEGERGVYKGAEKYRYDTDGFLAEKCSYYLSTLRQAFLYTYYYDKEGNWIKGYLYHVTPTEGFLYEIITREITYFD